MVRVEEHGEDVLRLLYHICCPPVRSLQRVSLFISPRDCKDCGSAYCVFGVWLELAGRDIVLDSVGLNCHFFWIQLDYGCGVLHM